MDGAEVMEEWADLQVVNVLLPSLAFRFLDHLFDICQSNILSHLLHDVFQLFNSDGAGVELVLCTASHLHLLLHLRFDGSVGHDGRRYERERKRERWRERYRVKETKKNTDREEDRQSVEEDE